MTRAPITRFVAMLITAIAMTCIILTGPVLAEDMRLTMLVDDSRIEEMLIKGSQVMMSEGTGSRVIYECLTDEYTYVSDTTDTYWRGSMTLMAEQLRAELAPMMAFIEQIFGGTPKVDLRFRHLDDTEVFGFTTRHVVVEESEAIGGVWRLRGELWLSEELEATIRSQYSACENIGEQWARMHNALLTLIYTPGEEDLDEYFTLFHGAFPVRFHMITVGAVEQRELIGVDYESISGDRFHVPDHYVRADSITAILGPGVDPEFLFRDR